MSIRVTNVRLDLEDEEVKIVKLIAKRLKITPDLIKGYTILKKSIDARRNSIQFVYSVEVDLFSNEDKILARLKKEPTVSANEELKIPLLTRGNEKLKGRPIVIGAGPAGIFASLILASYGYKPLLLERGSEVHKRAKDIEVFWSTGKLSLNSNIQFGEGGAGTFSDGKLTTRINDYRIKQVLETFVEAGAPEDILYLNKPHLGTDRLRDIVVKLRQKIVALGGEVRFDNQVTGIILEKDKVAGVVVNDKEEIYSNIIVLAIGHSARDTYESLYKAGVNLEAKAFAIGARIEHCQKIIDEAQYGKYIGHPKLGAADYQLVYNNKNLNRAAYTFCMCPGGVVVGAASESEGVVTNGMSEYNRDSGIANSALVVSVDPDDFDGQGPLAGIDFQRKWEKKAYSFGGGSYKAPVQKVADFLAGRPTSDEPNLKDVTYRPGVTPGDIHDTLPSFVTEMMEEAISDFGRKLKNFDSPDALLTGVETRTSAPIRILRTNELQAVDIEGLYPAGEGAGYAGGITSAAVDGIKVAEKIINRYGKGE